MAASSTYPIDSGPLIRGDPLAITIDIRKKINGVAVPQDVSGWLWRAHVRRSADAALVTQFDIDVITPVGGSVPSTVVMRLSPDQTRLLRTGMVSDLEQLDPNQATPTPIRTWWQISKFLVNKDVSHA